MPDCGHRDASCVVGNFYTCKTAGCANGPAERYQPGPRKSSPFSELRKYISIEAKLWAAHYSLPGIHLVVDDGHAAVLRETDDIIEVRLRRLDPNPAHPGTYLSTWGRLLISGATVAKVARNPAKGFAELNDIICLGLGKVRDCIADSDPGSGLAVTIGY